MTKSAVVQIAREGNPFGSSGLSLFIVLTLACCPSLLLAQQSGSEDLPVSTDAVPLLPEAGKRIFGIIPNNRTWPSLADYKPLSIRGKILDCPSGLI